MGFGRVPRRALVATVAGTLLAALVAVPLLRPAVADGAGVVCDNAPLPGAPTIKVLVFGDSLTASSAGDFTWRYRYWKQQRDLGVNVDFVGPITGLMGTLDHPVPNNEEYADPCFAEREHWAVGGKRLSQTFQPPWWLTSAPDAPSEIAWAVAAYAPDVVVEFMGANDLAKDPVATPSQLVGLAKQFVDEVRSVSPTTEIALATTTSNRIATAETYNALLKQQAPGWATDGSRIGIIDVMRDWQGIPDTWDGYHGNARGEMHLAWNVGEGLADLGFGLTPPRPIPEVAIGPRVPALLGLHAVTASSATLRWTAPVGADRITVFLRDLSTGGGWLQAMTVSLGTGVTVTGLDPHRYEFRVQAAKGTATAADIYSAPVVADLRASAVLGRVAAPSAVPAYHRVSLSWPAVPGADQYRVRWRPVGASAWTTTFTAGTSFPVTRLTAGARYAFRVTARRAGTLGPESPEVVRVPRGTVNVAPPRPRLVHASGHRVGVSWRAATDATRYLVQVRRVGGTWRTLGWARGTRITSGRLVAGRTYAFRVRPYDGYVAGYASSTSRIRVR